MSRRCFTLVRSCLVLLCGADVSGHQHTPITHSFDSGVFQTGPSLRLSITDSATGAFTAARFSVWVDGREHDPAWIDSHGIRFTSIHQAKNERFTALYARGTGEVLVALPSGAQHIEVIVSRGFEYLTASASGKVEHDELSLDVAVARWTDLEKTGWISVDAHLHFDRLDPADDVLWLTIMEADGLTAGHFMVLKGGMVSGVWARQFAYGPQGQAGDGRRIIIPGQEYRDPAQGHITLLGIDQVIEPISTGGLGSPATPENYPPLHDVLLRARSLNAFVGVAHAGTLGRSATAVADAVLGAVDFWELSNGFIYSTDIWYRLMNCGFFLPPAAGTDLPNSPDRHPWQPMLGSIRTYVDTRGLSDFQ